MGIRHTPLLYVGRKFEDQYEAKEWYENFVDISEEDQEYIDQENFSEYLYNKGNIQGEILDAYNGYGFVIGFDIGANVHNPDMFASEVTSACLKWNDMFKEEPFEIIHTVRIS